MVGYSVWSLVAHSDRMSIIILLILFFLSIITWSAGIFCVRFLIQEIKAFSQLFELLQASETKDNFVQALYQKKARNIISSADVFMFAQLSKVDRFHKIIGNGISFTMITDFLNASLYRAVDDYSETRSKFSAIFGTIAGISPLLGLLGTVWGLIHAFLEISQTQVADLASVAPGISEALITTLAGLLVAIPALVFANVVNSKIASLGSCIEECAVQYRMLVLSALMKDSDASQ